MPFLAPYTAWLADFVAEHRRACQGTAYNIDLKETHTLKVLEEARTIAAEAVDDPRLRDLACLAALLHDAGRFPQYLRHRTFRDDISENHGWLGSRTLRERGVLAGLPPAEATLVAAAVHLHNRRQIPRAVPAQLHLVLQVVRDADKIDILRVFRQHHLHNPTRDGTVTLHLVDDPQAFSPELLAQDGHPDYRKLRYCNDYVLLLLSWAFDLNFAASRRAMLQRGAVDEFLDILPRAPQIEAFGRRVRAHLKG